MFTCDSIIDFDNSFATYIVKEFSNFGRFKIESVTTVHEGNLKEEYILLSPVMACDVYGKGDLFKEPPYFFQALFSNSHYKIFRTYLPGMKQDNSCGRIEKLFEELKKCIVNKECRRLTDKNEVIAAVMANRPLSARITFENQNGFDVSTEFPIKHINVHPEQEVFQVETGTVVLPDLNNYRGIEGFNVGYVAFNLFDIVSIMLSSRLKSFNRECKIHLYSFHNE